MRPVRQIRRIELFVRKAIGNRDLDVVLVRWNTSTAVHKLFEHGRRVVVAGIDHRAYRCIPSSWIQSGTRCVEDRIRAVRVTNPIAAQDPVQRLGRQTADPYCSRPRTSKTSWPPSSFSIATSIGRRPSRSWWGRNKKSRVSSSEPQIFRAKPHTPANLAIRALGV